MFFVGEVRDQPAPQAAVESLEALAKTIFDSLAHELRAWFVPNDPALQQTAWNLAEHLIEKKRNIIEQALSSHRKE